MSDPNIKRNHACLYGYKNDKVKEILFKVPWEIKGPLSKTFKQKEGDLYYFIVILSFVPIVLFACVIFVLSLLRIMIIPINKSLANAALKKGVTFSVLSDSQFIFPFGMMLYI